ncbi:YncE family protein [Legionella worsleiensis]|nr:YncE family protein [Legionella worsleiensis]
MLINNLRFISLASLLFAGTAFSGTSAPLLAVVEENANHVSIYNPESGKKLGSLEIGFLPHEIAVTKDGKTAYVSNFGIRDYDSGSGTPGASISVIDLPSLSEQYRLYTFDPADYKDYEQIDSAPHGVKLRPPYENQLFVNVEKGHKVLVFDVNEKKLVKQIPVNSNTHNLYFSPDGKTLWLMAGKDGVIRVDADSGQVTGSVTLPTAVRGLKYTPDNRYLMASAVNQIVFIDPDSMTIQRQFNNLGVGPILYSDITPDQRYIIAPAAFDHQVIVIDVASGKVIKRLVTGLNPINVLISTDGQFAYISNATDKHISKIDLNSFEVTSFRTHEGPNGLAFIPSFKNKAHKTLTLGVALPFTGSDGLKGREMMRGYEYWRSTLTKAGGLVIDDQAYDVNIVYLDTESQPEKQTTLTQELISQYKVQVLLSTYGDAAYALEKKQAESAQILITPKLTEAMPWQPDDLARGHDYFITTHLYERGYIAQYNFKPSSWSAQATTTGLLLQNALQTAHCLDKDTVTRVFDENHFDFFYPYNNGSVK